MKSPASPSSPAWNDLFLEPAYADGDFLTDTDEFADGPADVDESEPARGKRERTGR
ncbi:hypothetical protein ACIQ7Q_21555 [Streptomyces sp. NPDC096176]|uniref:hypothetical protein n=1 Tax=Streptomyces sp. NPDC096176 TaxID=3366079 RepID=UPI00381FA0FF